MSSQGSSKSRAIQNAPIFLETSISVPDVDTLTVDRLQEIVKYGRQFVSLSVLTHGSATEPVVKQGGRFYDAVVLVKEIPTQLQFQVVGIEKPARKQEHLESGLGSDEVSVEAIVAVSDEDKARQSRAIGRELFQRSSQTSITAEEAEKLISKAAFPDSARAEMQKLRTLNAVQVKGASLLKAVGERATRGRFVHQAVAEFQGVRVRSLTDSEKLRVVLQAPIEGKSHREKECTYLWTTTRIPPMARPPSRRCAYRAISISR